LTPGFRPPPYPYDRLGDLQKLAAAHDGGVVDLSVGTPCDPPPPLVVAALGSSGTERGYPTSLGSAAMREASVEWLGRRLGVDVPLAAVAACVGTKEFVATVPQWLRLREPERDTVLYPAISYPTYAMGAVLAGCRAVPVSLDDAWHLDLATVDDQEVERALCLWVNSPANPTGAVDDLAAAVRWGRAHGVPVFSDECYVEFTWNGKPASVLQHGLDGVVAVHSLSKRSNLAGLRVGFYAGDLELVHYLAEVRKHAGFMVPGPIQAAAVAALADQIHVEEQRARYRERLDLFADVLSEHGVGVDQPEGGFYLWAAAPGDDAWGFADLLARDGGCLVSPGEFYGPTGAGHVRIALVQPGERLQLVADRLAGTRQ
jgi:succinyldiaminopimelate transaminase